MQFSKMAHLLSRVAAASAFLTPQTQPPSVKDSHACFAVVELVMIAFATLLPTLILCFLEVLPFNCNRCWLWASLQYASCFVLCSAEKPVASSPHHL